ncbi:unnamed protein product [Trichobilharzia regenti]|nr:unnamed protein product [Trichobilharzia regenti]
MPTISQITASTTFTSTLTTPLNIPSTAVTITSLLSTSLRMSANLLMQSARLYELLKFSNHNMHNSYQNTSYSRDLNEVKDIPINLEYKSTDINSQQDEICLDKSILLKTETDTDEENSV